MKSPYFQWVATAGLVAGLLGASSGAMAASDWVFTNSAGKTNADGTAATTYTGNPTSSPDLTIGGVYSAGGTGNWVSNSASTLQYYSGSGLGMGSDGTSAPNHALDNNGNTEAVLLNFSTSVVLSSIGIGYKSGDADVSVFRWVGTGAPTGSTTSPSAMGSWQLVGNYGDLGTDTSAPYTSINSGSLGSSWWLVSAYNASYGTTSANGKSLNAGDDYFKLYGVAGDTCTSKAAGVCSPPGNTSNKVPEPASLALVAAGLFGIFGSRRRSAAARTTAAV